MDTALIRFPPRRLGDGEGVRTVLGEVAVFIRKATVIQRHELADHDVAAGENRPEIVADDDRVAHIDQPIAVDIQVRIVKSMLKCPECGKTMVREELLASRAKTRDT